MGAGVAIMPNVGKGTATSPDAGWPLYIISVVMVNLSGIFVIIRIAGRMSRKMMGLDDYIILFVRPLCMDTYPQNHVADKRTRPS